MCHYPSTIFCCLRHVCKLNAHINCFCFSGESSKKSFCCGAFQDELLLLKKGGQVVYHGELGRGCRTLVGYFESKGAPEISLGENPANWMLRVITSPEMKNLTETYLHSQEYFTLRQEQDVIVNNHDEFMKIEYHSEFATSTSRRRELVDRRLQLIYWRSADCDRTSTANPGRDHPAIFRYPPPQGPR